MFSWEGSNWLQCIRCCTQLPSPLCMCCWSPVTTLPAIDDGCNAHQQWQQPQPLTLIRANLICNDCILQQTVYAHKLRLLYDILTYGSMQSHFSLHSSTAQQLGSLKAQQLGSLKSVRYVQCKLTNTVVLHKSRQFLPVARGCGTCSTANDTANDGTL